jgi:8-oxo-dGTP diphosphatase
MKSLDVTKLASVNVVAGVVIIKEDKVLLVQEAYETVRGKWNLPAGKVDLGETVEEAAVREAKEETGLDVKLIRQILVMHQAIDRPVLHAFTAEITGGELKFEPEELLDAGWFTIDEVMRMDGLRNNEFIRNSIKLALES